MSSLCIFVSWTLALFILPLKNLCFLFKEKKTVDVIWTLIVQSWFCTSQPWPVLSSSEEAKRILQLLWGTKIFSYRSYQGISSQYSDIEISSFIQTNLWELSITILWNDCFNQGGRISRECIFFYKWVNQTKIKNFLLLFQLILKSKLIINKYMVQYNDL